MTQDRPYLPPFAAIRAFEAFGRHGRVRRAATALGVSHAIVSRHLRALEDWLGVMLIDRKAGGLTEAGREYHTLISLAFDQLCNATQQARGGLGHRTEIWSVPGLAYLWITGRLGSFSQLHPSVAIDLRPTDSSPDLVRHEADADIRWLRDDELVAVGRGLSRTLIARPRIFPVARADAPWLRGKIFNQPGDLLDLPLLHENNDAEWRLWFVRQGHCAPLPEAAARLWQAHMTLAAARDGQGVALTNRFLASEHLDNGTLVEIGAETLSGTAIGGYYLTTREDCFASSPLGRFKTWLLDTVSTVEAEFGLEIPADHTPGTGASNI